MSKVWIDGRLVEKLDARVSVHDHGFLFGDGAAEGMRAYGGRVFRLADHLARPEDIERFCLDTIAWFDTLPPGPRISATHPGSTDGFIRALRHRQALVPLLEEFAAAKHALHAVDFADQMTRWAELQRDLADNMGSWAARQREYADNLDRMLAPFPPRP